MLIIEYRLDSDSEVSKRTLTELIVILTDLRDGTGVVLRVHAGGQKP